MVTRVPRPLRVVAFNANGIERERCELSRQLQVLHVDVTLFWETHLKPRERFFIPKYHFYRTDRYPGKKGGTAVAVNHIAYHSLFQ
jgi:hypothetical protein